MTIFFLNYHLGEEKMRLEERQQGSKRVVGKYLNNHRNERD